MPKYTMVCERDEEGWWVASVKEVAGVHTQGRSIQQARTRLREALAAAIGDRAAAAAELELSLVGMIDIRNRVSATKKAQDRAEREQAHAAELSRKLARELVKRQHLSYRDAGEVMGISGGRVQQLLKD